MLKRKPLLFFTVMFAVVTLFAATQAGANGDPCVPNPSPGDGVCCDQERATFECFESGGYLVEILPDIAGNFPAIVDGDSVFSYSISKQNGAKKLLLVDLLVSVCDPGLVIESSSPNGRLFTGGQGGLITKFGRYLTGDDTWWWNYKGDGGEFSLTFEGHVVANPNDMLLKTASLWWNWGRGQILAPACAQSEIFGGAFTSGRECITVETGEFPISISLTRNTATTIGNVLSVRMWRSTDCTRNAVEGDPVGGNVPDISQPEGFRFCTGGSGQKNECITLTADSPGCVDYYIGGTLCHFCWQ